MPGLGWVSLSKREGPRARAAGAGDLQTPKRRAGRIAPARGGAHLETGAPLGSRPRPGPRGRGRRRSAQRNQRCLRAPRRCSARSTSWGTAEASAALVSSPRPPRLSRGALVRWFATAACSGRGRDRIKPRP